MNSGDLKDLVEEISESLKSNKSYESGEVPDDRKNVVPIFKKGRKEEAKFISLMFNPGNRS